MVNRRTTPSSGSLSRSGPVPAPYARSAETRTAAIERARAAVTAPPPRAKTALEVFEGYVEHLLATVKDASSVASGVRTWLGPMLGHLPPEACDHARMAVVCAEMLAAGRSPNTVRARAAYARAAFAWAHRTGRIATNPIPSLRGVVPPRRTREGFNPRAEILSVGALERLVCSARVPQRERVMYLIAATAGLRVGELVELRVADIDRAVPELDDGAEPVEGREGEARAAALHITRQWARKRKKVKAPKGGGPRTIAVRPDVLAVLDAWLELAWPRRYGRLAAPNDLVFPADVSDDPRAEVVPLEDRRQDDRSVLERLHRNLERVGLAKRRQHAFRHTFVSLLVNAGVPPHVAEQFTHPAPVATVEIYAHYSYRTLHEAVRRIPLRLREPSGQLELFDDEAYGLR